MGVQDAQLHIGRETTYGTPASPLTRSIESRADLLSSHKYGWERLRTSGVRANKQTHTSARSRIVTTGAEGEIPLSLMNKGMGMFFRAMMGLSVAPVQQGATTAYLQTHSSSAQGPSGESLTVQIGLPPATISATPLPFTYHGGKVASWEFSQEIGDEEGGIGSLTLSMDYEDVDTSTALLAVPVYPAVDWDFGWPDFQLTVNSVIVEPLSFTLSGDNALKTDRRYMRQNVLKKEPFRTGIPTYQGQFNIDFENLTQYNQFVAGTIVPLEARWRGPLIASTFYNEIKITCAAIQYTGETPEGSFDDTPTQPLPFDVLWNGTDPAVKIEYMSTDTAY